MNYSINLKRLMCVGFVLGLLSVATVGCGDDEDDNNGGTGGTAGTGTGGTAGTGDTGGSGGSTGGTGGSTGGTGGSTGGTGGGMATIMCGTATCSPVSAGGMMVPPCCDMDHGNICGATTSAEGQCTGLMQPGVDDPSCPTIKNALEMDAPPCCTPAGLCGFRSASLMGCIERSVYPEQFLSAMPATTAMFPLQEIPCGDEDAGM